MDIVFKKKKDALINEVVAKSSDFEHGVEDFKAEIENCSLGQKFITISPECVRCNLCVEECPVNAIDDAKITKPAKILENCVKCEICAQTCPVNAVKVIESTSDLDEDVTYKLNTIKVPHRTLRMEKICVDKDKCTSCGDCVKFCPTGAIKVPEGEKAVVDLDACIGCGACANVCGEDAVTVIRRMGNIFKTKDLVVDDDACVACGVCEENCPVEAIKLEDDKIIFSEDKCILCEVCSKKCPVSALKLERLPK
ncbi:4Fe-4S binding protein [Methanobacterium spitsbergense]|uniref:4Fe-4S binding protein n=1 Tax=Methanobacterium spitsbergense TaxID=2874285 RepID=A0A8T5V404_9EURY|nr:4Fe-4S binding protein [Methanobacterium spitsbergense]MBZ2166601.1 4Fe-4S binding protein [Methanobacterium spitsbergense]